MRQQQFTQGSHFEGKTIRIPLAILFYFFLYLSLSLSLLFYHCSCVFVINHYFFSPMPPFKLCFSSFLPYIYFSALTFYLKLLSLTYLCCQNSGIIYIIYYGIIWHTKLFVVFVINPLKSKIEPHCIQRLSP
jgi:hypothetical protein